VHDGLLWATDFADTTGPYLTRAAEELAVLLAAIRPDDPRAWRPDPFVAAPTNVEQPTPTSAPDQTRTRARTRVRGEGSTAAPGAGTEQLGLFGDPTDLAEDQAAPEAGTDSGTPLSDDELRAQLARTELIGAADIRYWMFGSMRPGEPETMRFYINRQTRSYSFSQPIFSGTRDECLAYIESEAAVRSAAESDENSEQQAAALAWLRDAGMEAPAAPGLATDGDAVGPTLDDVAPEAATDTPAAVELPELDVVLPEVDLATLDVAGPYETDEEAQADIDRLSAAFARWDALPTVQRFYEEDRKQRPDGQRIPTNPVSQLAAAYRDAERMLQEGPSISPDDLVLEVHTVAVWSGVLESVVDEDLRGPLRQVREAATLLASRSRATVVAFEAELATLTANSTEQNTAAP
jgi:hypothetical protein